MIEERLKYTREKPALRKVLALSLTPNNSQPPPKKVLAPAITPNAMNYVAKPVCSGAPSQKLQSHLKPKVSEKNIEISVPKAENEPEKDLIVSRKNSLFTPTPNRDEMRDDDDRWLKMSKIQEKIPVERIISANGKVKKGSGVRYDYKKGYSRYFSSSEEETASEEDDDDDFQPFIPTSLPPSAVMNVNI
jgi:hypothetical protein